MLYSYKAIDKQGSTQKGQINAANERDLEERIKVIGLDIISYKEKSAKKPFFQKGISTKELVLICVQLEQLEKAGVPILQSIGDLRDTAESSMFKNVMAEVYEDITSGMLLAAAMAKHPKVFSHVFTGIIAAGEKTGNLSDIFAHLTHHLKWADEIRRKTIKAIMFPIGMICVLSGVISILMVFVIPKLLNFLLSQNIKLPFYTTALISTSHAFTSYWYIILAVPVSLFMFIRLMLKSSEALAFKADTLKLKLPIVGHILRKIELARFCRFFSLTYKSGLGILECLIIARDSLQNRVMRKSIDDVHASVATGVRLTEALRASNQFPSLVLRMFKVGEDSGKFESSLENVNFFYDKEVEDGVENMVGVIKPSLTVVLGGILFWIIAAVFGPLYGSFSQMNL